MVANLDEGRAGPVEGDDADCLVDLQVEEEDLAWIEEDDVVATREVEDELEALVERD